MKYERSDADAVWNQPENHFIFVEVVFRLTNRNNNNNRIVSCMRLKSHDKKTNTHRRDQIEQQHSIQIQREREKERLKRQKTNTRKLQNASVERRAFVLQMGNYNLGETVSKLKWQGK